MLVAILVAILWVIVGVWISYKRNWYEGRSIAFEIKVINFIFAPICLVIAFIGEFIIGKWNNESI